MRLEGIESSSVAPGSLLGRRAQGDHSCPILVPRHGHKNGTLKMELWGPTFPDRNPSSISQ